MLRQAIVSGVVFVMVSAVAPAVHADSHPPPLCEWLIGPTTEPTEVRDACMETWQQTWSSLCSPTTMPACDAVDDQVLKNPDECAFGWSKLTYACVHPRGGGASGGFCVEGIRAEVGTKLASETNPYHWTISWTGSHSGSDSGSMVLPGQDSVPIDAPDEGDSISISVAIWTIEINNEPIEEASYSVTIAC